MKKSRPFRILFGGVFDFQFQTACESTHEDEENFPVKTLHKNPTSLKDFSVPGGGDCSSLTLNLHPNHCKKLSSSIDLILVISPAMHAGLFFLESSIPYTRVDGKCHRVIFLWFCPVGWRALWLSSGLPFWKVLQLRAAVSSSALSFSNVREQNQGMEGDIQRSLICVWTGALHINWSILSLIAKGLILGSHYDLEVTGWWWGLRGRTAATTRQWPLGSILMMAWWMTLELFEQQSSPESLQVLDRGITGTIGEGDLKPLIKLAKACESYLAISNSVYHGNKGVRHAISNSEAVAAPLPEAHLLQELWNLCSWFFFVPDFNLWWQHSALQTLVNILEKPQSLTILKLTPSLLARIGILNLQQSAIKALEKISKRWPKDVANAGGRSELAKRDEGCNRR
ncbi:hypothetical protein SAY87_000172 [Trapa incisa]|uniref:Uncharacterized protein n=1 Tax=Trapa incisa TaxID=236973 RepID=A0AAN7GEX2_9MYRT|nr:hypothetical protein SAY87_000172 [Trapa incisa]